MEKFTKFSGLVINFEKTTAVKLGPFKKSDAKFYTMKELAWTDDPVKILGIWFHPDPLVMEEMNFFRKLNKVETILKTWSHCSSTILGKILIVNTLANSQLTYQLAALPTPSNLFFIKYKRLITNFLWNQKPAKIAYNKLIQQYANHRLQLIDIKAKEVALKAKWPLYFHNRTPIWLYWKLPTPDESIWECNTDLTHIRMLTKQVNPLIRDIWMAWSQATYVTPQNASQMANQKLCGNSMVTRAGKPFFQKQLITAQINKVANLLDENGNLLPAVMIADKCDNRIDLMLLNSLISALPNLWKITLRNDYRQQSELTKVQKYKVTPRPTKIFYQENVKRVLSPSSTKKKVGNRVKNNNSRSRMEQQSRKHFLLH